MTRAIQEKAWRMFITILKQKTEEHGRTIVYIDPWYPSSKTCNECGHINEDLELKDRTLICTKCDTTHDRDINAAKNIHQEGLKNLKKKK